MLGIFEFIPEVQENDLGLRLVTEAVKELKSQEVLVGIPAEEASRPDGVVNNAELLYIHTNGSPAHNIPARPVIEPAIEDGKEILGSLLGQACDRALNGDMPGMQKALESAGMQGENMSKAWFTNPKNNWDELGPAAIRARERKMRLPKIDEEDKDKNKKDDKNEKNKPGEQKLIHRPLIDTAEMRKSITHVIRRKDQ